VSLCGNWVAIGLENGTLHRYAIQSQQHRGEYRLAGDKPAHSKAVTKVAFTGGMDVREEDRDGYESVNYSMHRFQILLNTDCIQIKFWLKFWLI
jgi:hypothetical protein